MKKNFSHLPRDERQRLGREGAKVTSIQRQEKCIEKYVAMLGTTSIKEVIRRCRIDSWNAGYTARRKWELRNGIQTSSKAS